MLLRNAPVAAIVPTTEIERAKRFYTETLGLPLADMEMEAPATVAFACGGETMLVVYEREGGTQADHTVAGWMVDDVEKTVEELTEKGVVFEQYDMPNLKTDERGIAELGGEKAAWFKDPDGNILSITEGPD